MYKTNVTHGSFVHADSFVTSSDFIVSAAVQFANNPVKMNIYVDGCVLSDNRAGAGVFWGEGDHRNIAKRLGWHHTSLTAEIAAAVTAIKQATGLGFLKFTIVTDCDAVVEYANGKRKEPAIDAGMLYTWVHQLLECLKLPGLNVSWDIVKAHSHIRGNEEANRLARLGAEKPDN
ncbi:unnamed protein product [Dicrocoelium dendriticum]|nr:unnamed protein product [Dicrocoelium dendriticum]